MAKSKKIAVEPVVPATTETPVVDSPTEERIIGKVSLTNSQKQKRPALFLNVSRNRKGVIFYNFFLKGEKNLKGTFVPHRFALQEVLKNEGVVFCSTEKAANYYPELLPIYQANCEFEARKEANQKKHQSDFADKIASLNLNI